MQKKLNYYVLLEIQKSDLRKVHSRLYIQVIHRVLLIQRCKNSAVVETEKKEKEIVKLNRKKN